MELEMLVARAQKGDKKALVELLDQRKDDYYRLAYAYTQNREDAMDAIQEMCLLTYRQIRNLRKRSSFYSWSNTILVNCCRSMLKKRTTLPFKEEEEMPDVRVVPVHEAEDRMDLEAGLSQLKTHHREAVTLRYYLDMDYETMAGLLQIPIGTVKSRVHNGLKRLKEYLEGGDGK